MKRSARRDAGRPRGDAVVEAVMMCSLDELAAHGVADLSIERIAEAAEVNKTTIYRRWPSREALVAAALEYVMLDLSALNLDTGSLRGDLLSLAMGIAEFMTQPWGRALARAAMADGSGRSVTALAAQQLARGVAVPIGELVARAKRRGEWRATMPPETVFSLLAGSIFHRALLEHQPPKGAWLDGVVDVIVRGVGP